MVWKLGLVKRLDANREPEAVLATVPEPTRNCCKYESPEDIELSCMFSLSVGVYQRRFGGLTVLAVAMRVEVVTLLEVKMFGLLASLLKPVKGKWSFPLGQPSAQYACQVRPADCI